MKSTKKLTTREYALAIFRVAKITYDSAPIAVVAQLVGAIISAVLPIVTTYFAAQATTALAEAYAGSQDAGNRAIQYVVVTAVLGILMTGWTSLQSYITKLMRYRVEAAMSDRMYQHFLSLEFWRYDDKETADLYDRSTRFANFFPYVFDRLSGIVSAFMTLVISLGALILVSWWLGLIMVAAVLPGLYIQFKLSRAQMRHWNENIETRRAKGIIEYGLFQQPRYIAELRLYGMVRYLLDLRLRLRDKDEKEQIEFERKYIVKKLGADALEAIAEVVALLFTVFEIIARHQPIGQFLYVQQIVSRALSGSSSLVSQLSSIDQDLANLFDYQQFMNLPVRTSGENKLQEIPDKITLKNIGFSYPNSEIVVLKNISLAITKGEHIAIVGENGAGKSTLIKLLLGLYDPTEGSVLLDGHDLRDIAISSWHSKLGVLQQDYLGYGFATARENIYFGDIIRDRDEARYEKAIDLAETRKFLNKLPNKADSYISTWMEDSQGNNGVDLSGGQWQRLALARNFYRDSPIIVLDEPTSAIDALAESRIFRHLLKDKSKTIITISHRLTTIEKADRIYMLEEGRLVEEGTHEELVKMKGAYYTMFESQLRSTK